ncbi:DUF2889 domain-containing protein [Amycolatopsis sp. NPDC005232]|uniref:DUF2889 domain-containing protein n=1 Tax=Amycolatopsis sp. NPDC005232 TaxID=3157027 RepID=UPI0033B4DC82
MNTDPSVTRAKTMQVTPAGEGRFRFTARLTDSATGGDFSGETATIHDFGLDGEVEGPDLILISLDVQAYAHPYADCPFIIPATQALLGKSVLSGWRGAVLAQGRGTRGCTHVNTLLIGLAELSTMIYFIKINSNVAYTPETRADGRWTLGALDVSPGLGGDICYGLRTEGRALTATQALRAGDPPPHGNH